MSYPKQFLNFYINSSIHVALSVCALTLVTLFEFNVGVNKDFLYFLFFATITGYNFVKYFGVAKFHHRKLANWLKSIQVFSFFCFLLMCFFGLKLPFKTQLFILGFAIVTFFYAIPFLPKHFFVDKQHNLRSIGGLKIYLIALVWSGVTVFLPLINENFNVDIFIIGIQRYMYIIVLMFPFEIRDLRFDSLKLSTIPQKIGERNTKIIGASLVLVILILECFKDKIVIENICVLSTVLAITLVFLLVAKKNQGKYFSSFWVESIPIFWVILLLLVS